MRQPDCFQFGLDQINWFEKVEYVVYLINQLLSCDKDKSNRKPSFTKQSRKKLVTENLKAISCRENARVMTLLLEERF